MSEMDDTYVAITRGIRVTVRPHYLEDQSDPDSSRFVWAYHIEIENSSAVTVQLRERHWEITDARGRMEIVDGPGVVGEQPILNPGDRFQYSSGCPLSTSSGFMSGHYRMFSGPASNGACEEFNIRIPAFALDLPNLQRRLN